MTTCKNYNSVIFLTTLSVYLGLALVGAPPILAHAALTRNFDIQNEVEVRDDLDKKPDDEKALADYASALENLFVLAEDFSTKNNGKLKDGRYEFDCFVNVGSGANPGVVCSGGNNWFWGGFITPLAKLNKIFAHTNVKDKQQIKVNLVLSGEEFSLKTVLNQDSNEEAEQFSKFYDAGLSKIRTQQLNSSRTNLYENTKISALNNQVFIVTRLPRGSLDALLAQRSAQ